MSNERKIESTVKNFVEKECDSLREIDKAGADALVTIANNHSIPFHIFNRVLSRLLSVKRRIDFSPLNARLNQPCVRVAIHFRAGDVFQHHFGASSDEEASAVDGRAIPLRHIRKITSELLDRATKMAVLVRLYVLTELSFADQLAANDVFPEAVWLTHSSDEAEHLALAAAADLLLLGYSAFSWLFALLARPDAVKLVHQPSILHMKYKNISNSYSFNESSKAIDELLMNSKKKFSDNFY